MTFITISDTHGQHCSLDLLYVNAIRFELSISYLLKILCLNILFTATQITQIIQKYSKKNNFLPLRSKRVSLNWIKAFHLKNDRYFF